MGICILNLWSSACAPLYCGNFPNWEKTYSQYKEKGLDILLISIDKSMDEFSGGHEEISNQVYFFD